jgi:hypothetical protein
MALGLVGVKFAMASHEVVESDRQSLRLLKAKLIDFAECLTVKMHALANACAFRFGISPLMRLPSLVHRVAQFF